MHVLRAVVLVGVACVTLAAPLACADDGGTSQAETRMETPTPVAGIAMVTMTDDACRLEGRDTVSDGHLTVELVAETDGDGAIELLRLADGIALEALEAHIEDEAERLERGESPLGYDLFATRELAAEFVGPERRYVLTPQPDDLEPGAHVFLCVHGSDLELAGPLEILP